MNMTNPVHETAIRARAEAMARELGKSTNTMMLELLIAHAKHQVKVIPIPRTRASRMVFSKGDIFEVEDEDPAFAKTIAMEPPAMLQ